MVFATQISSNSPYPYYPIPSDWFSGVVLCEPQSPISHSEQWNQYISEISSWLLPSLPIRKSFCRKEPRVLPRLKRLQIRIPTVRWISMVFATWLSSNRPYNIPSDWFSSGVVLCEPRSPISHSIWRIWDRNGIFERYNPLLVLLEQANPQLNASYYHSWRTIKTISADLVINNRQRRNKAGTYNCFPLAVLLYKYPLENLSFREKKSRGTLCFYFRLTSMCTL
jgi:hypothetical protein